MANTKHTPGPYEVRGIGVFSRGTGELLATMSYAPNRAEAEANAQFFAAAPELLKALKRVRTLLPLLTVSQVIHGSNEQIEAAGLNPWCMNEGQAEGRESVSTWWIDAAIAEAEGRHGK